MLLEMWFPMIDLVMQFAWIAIILVALSTFFYIGIDKHVNEERIEKRNDKKRKKEIPIIVNKMIIWFIKIFRRTEQKGEEDSASILCFV